MPPLISCLAVTLPVPARAAALRRAIADYQRQSYPNRELVLVLNGGDAACRQAIHQHVAALGDPGIRAVEPPGVLTLGALRNASMAAARGEVFCQWDDDDLYHPDRLANQAALLGSAACDAVLLRDVMQWITADRTLFSTNWHATEGGGFPGSLMVRRAAGIRYPEAGDIARLGEDSAVLRDLRAGHRVAVLPEQPWLYVYASHGQNSWPEGHHRMLNQELAVSRSLLLRREAGLRQGLAGIAFPPGLLTVAGYNGAAFPLATPAEMASS